MPTELRKDQHELMSEDESVRLVFGTEDTGYLTTAYPGIEVMDGTTGDVQRIREDGVSFGEDFLGGTTYNFEIGVLTDRLTPPGGDKERVGGDYLGALKRVWHHPRFRQRSAAYAVLRSNVAGRTTRCYGRPRRFAGTPGNTTKKGYTPVLADFIINDGRWYDDVEQVETSTLRPPTDGGLKAPLVAPLTTTAVSRVDSVMRVYGSESTWPVVIFHGPVTDPRVSFGPFEVGIRAALAEGASVTFDPRPWMRTVIRNDGANLAGVLTPDTPPMRRCLLEPGTYQMTFRGTDLSATSWVEVRWRNAYSQP